MIHATHVLAAAVFLGVGLGAGYLMGTSKASNPKGAEMHVQALDPPPLADNREASEVLRVWAASNDAQQMTLRTKWGDPAAWGLLLVDVARHASRAYAREGRDPAEALARIREGFDAEWSSPTDRPKDLTQK